MAKPLEGVRVVDLSQITAGPLGTMMLAEQGADVIKVEPVGVGEVVRNVTFKRGGITAWYVNHNRGKRSIAIDTDSAEGRAELLDLMASADVVVQNFRPGVMDRLGLGYDDVRARRDDIIYVSISGYGPTGPYANRPVVDPIIQATIGMVALQKSEAIPLPDLVRNVVVDKATAIAAAEAICAALFQRERTGVGNHIELPMVDAGLWFFWPDGMMDRTFLGEDAPGGVRIADAYQITHCSDGSLIYFTVSDAHRVALLHALGRDDVADDERWRLPAITEPDNFAAFGKIVAEGFAQAKLAEVLPALHAAEIPASAINEPDDVFADPQIAHNESIVEWEHPDAGRLHQPRHPVRFSSAETPAPTWADHLGQHTDEVLAEIGRTPERIAELRAAGGVA